MISLSRYEVFVVACVLLVVGLNTGVRAYMHAQLPEVSVIGDPVNSSVEDPVKTPASVSKDEVAEGVVTEEGEGGEEVGGERAEPADESGVEQQHDEKIDINTAGLERLLMLPGIGPTLAGRIMTYRVQRGPFTNVRELLNVKGIGEKRLERLLPFVVIGGSDD